jgi:hypothetical protein
VNIQTFAQPLEASSVELEYVVFKKGATSPSPPNREVYPSPLTLAISAFGISITEFIIMGFLPEVSAALGFTRW